MIEKSMLRFTIPFHISAKNMNKNNIFLALKSSGWKQEHIVQGENDLYDYITELVNDSVVNDVASSWKLPKELYIKNRYVTRVEGHEIDWNLEQIGLVIFSTEGTLPKIMDMYSGEEVLWDYKDFDLEYCNVFFKDNVWKIQSAYESYE